MKNYLLFEIKINCVDLKKTNSLFSIVILSYYLRWSDSENVPLIPFIIFLGLQCLLLSYCEPLFLFVVAATRNDMLKLLVAKIIDDSKLTVVK